MPAVLKDGRQQGFNGNYTLGAFNDVPGSIADDRRWRIFSATLQPAL